MRRTIPRTELYRIDEDSRYLAQNNPGIYLLLESKINLFREKNKVALQIMRSRFHDIQSRFIKKTSTGEFITIANGEDKEWDYVDNYVDVSEAKTLSRGEVKQKFIDECTAFYSQSITIEY